MKEQPEIGPGSRAILATCQGDIIIDKVRQALACWDNKGLWIMPHSADPEEEIIDYEVRRRRFWRRTIDSNPVIRVL